MLNILLITADQWRGDALGYAGNAVVKTPDLDALAAEGTAFLKHYANAAPCSPARACLYTGLYQMNNRVCRNGSPLANRFDNVALAARRAGYDPTLFGYTDVSLDPTGKAPNDPDLTTYESVLPGFTTRVKLPEHEKPWLSWLRAQGLELRDHEHAHLPITDAPNAPPAYSKDQTQTAFLTGEFIRWLVSRKSRGSRMCPTCARIHRSSSRRRTTTCTMPMRSAASSVPLRWRRKPRSIRCCNLH